MRGERASVVAAAADTDAAGADAADAAVAVPRKVNPPNQTFLLPPLPALKLDPEKRRSDDDLTEAEVMFAHGWYMESRETREGHGYASPYSWTA